MHCVCGWAGVAMEGSGVLFQIIEGPGYLDLLWLMTATDSLIRIPGPGEPVASRLL